MENDDSISLGLNSYWQALYEMGICVHEAGEGFGLGCCSRLVPKGLFCWGVGVKQQNLNIAGCARHRPSNRISP